MQIDSVTSNPSLLTLTSLIFVSTQCALWGFVGLPYKETEKIKLIEIFLHISSIQIYFDDLLLLIL